MPPSEYWILAPDEPSGMSWLLNALLSLDLEVFHNERSNFWKQNASGKYELHPDAVRFTVWLPACATRQEFTFREGAPAGKWLHDFPPAREVDWPIVFFMRDGRAACYSHYRRHKEEVISYSEYLGKPFRASDHNAPCTPEIGPLDSWAFHVLLWTRRLGSNHVMIRFEDTKIDPMKELSRAIEFLGESRSEEDLARAVNLSSLDEARRVQQVYESQGHSPLPYTVHRKGSVDEWKEIYGEKETPYVTGLTDLVLKLFNYEHHFVAPVPACASLSSPGAAAFAEAVRRIQLGDVHAGRERLTALTRTLSLDIELSFEVGKALSCFFWIQYIHPNATYESPFEQQTLRDLIYFSRFLSEAPLNVICAANRLRECGRADLGVHLVSERVKVRTNVQELKFHELIEGVKLFWRSKERQLAWALLKRASQVDVPMSEKVLAARDLYRQISPRLLAHFLFWAKCPQTVKIVLQEVVWGIRGYLSLRLRRHSV